MFWLSHRPNRKRARRKVENRRLPRKGREPKKAFHVLDAQTFSSRELQLKRAAQFRTILLCSALFLSVIALISTTRILLNKYIFENPELTISNLDVRVDGILSTQQIIQFAQIGKGQGLLSLRLDEIRNNLMAHPQIRNVKIEREFPGTLRIAVEERFAIAWLSSESPSIRPSTSGGVLLDESGVPFVCESLMREYMELPVVHVPRLRELIPGKRMENPQIHVALNLLQESRQALYDLNLEIHAVHAPNPYSIVAKYNNQSKVVFGLSDLPRQVSNLRAATLHAQSINQSIGSINLLMTRNIPVTYIDSAVGSLAQRYAPVYREEAKVVPVSRPSTAPPTLVPVGEVSESDRQKGKRDQKTQISEILGN